MRTLTILAAVLLAAPAFAQDLATGDAIKAAVSGNTIQGSMTSSGPYAEFYAEDGTIKGDGYTGFGRGAACTDDAVDDYLISGTTPAKNLTCTK